MYDLKNLAALKTMDKAAERGMKAFWTFDKAAFTPGALEAKIKQMMALAAAMRAGAAITLATHMFRTGG